MTQRGTERASCSLPKTFIRAPRFFPRPGGSLRRAAVSLAKDWRSDKALRHLEALLIAADHEDLLVISGSGEVIDPDDGIAAIGSGGNYALAAAKALKENTDLPAREIARKAIEIASEICVFTNGHITLEEV